MDTYHNHIGHRLIYSEKGWSNWPVQQTENGLRLPHAEPSDSEMTEASVLTCETCDVELEVPEGLQ